MEGIDTARNRNEDWSRLAASGETRRVSRAGSGTSRGVPASNVFRGVREKGAKGNMKTLSATILGFALALSALAEQPKVSQPAASFRLLSAQGRPILTDVDIVGYSWPTHTLILRPGVVPKLKSELMGTGKLVLGYPFKVEANGVVCYQGVFTTSLSSASQSCAVIDLDPIGKTPAERKNQLSITLGYPSEKFFRGKDPRGDPQIRAALTALGKLKDSDTKSSTAVSSQGEDRKPENLTMTLARIADSEKVDRKDYIFIINGVVAFRTLDGLKKHIKQLPKGSTLTWAPGCCRIGGEPLLSSKDEMQNFKAFCESCGTSFVLVPSG
jgi:hypothetical protein